MLLPLLLLVTAAVAATAQPAPLPPETVYDLLPKYGLPPGLLPDSVTSFSLADDGAFEVELAGPCYVDFDYPVYYAPKITGVIKYGGIQDLKGIQVRRFLVWFNVNSIKVDLPPSDYVYFQVGLINKQLNVKQFETVHSCKKNGVVERARACVAAAKDLCRLPEPIREIDMLLFE